MLRNKKTAIIAALFAMVLWGSAIPTIKITYQEMAVLRSDTGAKMLVAGIRFFMAGLLGFVYFKGLNKKPFYEVDYNLSYIIKLGLLQTTLQYLTYYIALSNTAGVKAAIIQSTNAFVTVILSAILIPNEKIKSNTVFAIALGTLGIVIVNGGLGSMRSSFNPLGDGFILISTTFNALASIYVRKNGRDQDPAFTTAAQFCLGSLPLIIIGLITKENPLNYSAKAILLLSYGAFISATAYIIWNSVLKYHNVSEMGMYRLFIPIFGALFSVLLLGESFTVNLLMGLVLVLAGTVILNIGQWGIIKK